MKLDLEVAPQPLRANLLGLAILLPVAVAIGWLADHPWWRTAWASPAYGALTAAAIGTALGLAVWATLHWISSRCWPRDDERELLALAAIRPGWPAILALSAGAAVFEEILFRAALVPEIGVLPAALAFTAMHAGSFAVADGWAMRLRWAIQIALIGVALGLVFEEFGLLAAIAMHFVYDVAALRAGLGPWQQAHEQWRRSQPADPLSGAPPAAPEQAPIR